MKLFKISQVKNRGYDTYDSAVVAAIDSVTASRMHPGDGSDIRTNGRSAATWVDMPSRVAVEYLGEARGGMPAGVVCASFNAG